MCFEKENCQILDKGKLVAVAVKWGYFNISNVELMVYTHMVCMQRTEVESPKKINDIKNLDI